MSILLRRIHIELTNVCNFKCQFCPDAVMERKRGKMELHLLRKILNEISHFPKSPTVLFHVLGEPLLYPHVFEAISLAVELGLNLELITNGSTLHLFPKNIQQLINSGIPKVTISLQTPDKDTFNLRGATKNLKAKQYFDGILRFTRDNILSDSNTIVQIKFMDSTPRFYSLPYKAIKVISGKEQIRKQLSDWTVKILKDVVPDSQISEIIDMEFARIKTGLPQVFHVHSKVSLYSFPLDNWGNLNLDKIYQAKFGYCDGASGQLAVLFNGTVVPCCTDYEGLIPLGDSNDKSFMQILNEPHAIELRNGFNSFKVQHPLCKKCLGANTIFKSIIRQFGSIVYYKVIKPMRNQRVSS